jgi:hypothetical protein
MQGKEVIIYQSNRNIMVKIIESYDKLPVGLYLQLCEAEERLTEDIDIAVNRVSILSGLSESEVLNLDLQEFQILNEKARFLEKDAPKTNVASKYVLGDYELIPCKDIRKMTTGQYIDYQAYCKQADLYIVDILSCFLVPKGMKYNDGYDIEDVKATIRENLSVCDVNALSDFFLNSLIASIAASLSCSERLAKKMKEGPEKTAILKEIQKQKDSFRNGDGYATLTWSRRLREVAGSKSST